MIVQALASYYEVMNARGAMPSPGWSSERVHYALSLSPEGQLVNLISLMWMDDSRKKVIERPRSMRVPERNVKSSGIKPNFLCENMSYIFGIDNKGKPKRSAECFAACGEYHIQILAETHSAAGLAVKRYFELWKPEDAAEHPLLKPILNELYTANFVFLVDGRFAHEDAEICAAWELYYGDDGDSSEIRCLVTGKIAPHERLQAKIKLPGGQPAGSNLISYNASAFESYGLEGGRNAAIGKYASFAHTTALNYLILENRHRQRIGGDTLVYWSESGSQETQNIFSGAVFESADETLELDAIMSRLSKGLALEGVDLRERFYVLCMSPNSARIAVRFFLTGTFGAMLDNCREHYERLEIVRADFERKYLSAFWLLQETVNQKLNDKNPSPLLGGAVLRSILTGARYPQSLYDAVLVRIRAEREVTRGRAAIIKAYLLRNADQIEKGEVTVALNETWDNTAYVLGRLFSVLEQAQETANGKATIKDRYFTSACATPKNVFPTLLKLSVHHLAKIDGGLSIHYGKQITELTGRINPNEATGEALPSYMDANSQGLFILGYYHQTQQRYQGKKKEEEN